jgi:hypothetical protein
MKTPPLKISTTWKEEELDIKNERSGHSFPYLSSNKTII